jgi:hypothetical protein
MDILTDLHRYYTLAYDVLAETWQEGRFSWPASAIGRVDCIGQSWGSLKN